MDNKVDIKELDALYEETKKYIAEEKYLNTKKSCDAYTIALSNDYSIVKRDGLRINTNHLKFIYMQSYQALINTKTGDITMAQSDYDTVISLIESAILINEIFHKKLKSLQNESQDTTPIEIKHSPLLGNKPIQSLQILVSNIKINYGYSLKLLDKYDEAETYYHQAHDCFERICRNNNDECTIEDAINLMRAKRHLAVINQAQGKLNKATTFYEEAISIMQDIHTHYENQDLECPPEYLLDFTVLGYHYSSLITEYSKEEYTIQINNYKDVINGFETVNKSLTYVSVKNLNYIAQAKICQGQLQYKLDKNTDLKSIMLDSISAMIDIKNICTQTDEIWLPEYQHDLAKTEYDLGRFCQSQNLLIEAAKHYRSASEISKELLDNHTVNDIPEHYRTFINSLNAYLLIINKTELGNFEPFVYTLIDIFELCRNPHIYKLAKHAIMEAIHCSIKYSNYSLLIKLVSCIQGRELMYKLASADITEDSLKEQIDIVNYKDKYLKSLDNTQLSEKSQKYEEQFNGTDIKERLQTIFDKRWNNDQRKEYFATVRDKLTQQFENYKITKWYATYRKAVRNIPEFSALLTPMDINISDLQQSLKDNEVALIWLGIDFDDNSSPISGIIAIPKSGTPQYIDLYSFLIKLSNLHQDLCVLLNSGRGYRKHPMQYNKNEYDRLVKLYSTSQDNLSSNTSALKTVWQQIRYALEELWQSERSQLFQWIKQQNPQIVMHLTHAQTHNLPLSMGCDTNIVHHFIPGLAVWRHRKAIQLEDNIHQNIDKRYCSQVHAAEKLAITNSNTDIFIPHTEFEKQSLQQLLKTNDLSIPFPNQEEPLSFAHVACHGVPDRKLQGGAKLILETEITAQNLEQATQFVDIAMLNACIGGTVHDSNRGEPRSLLVPLLTWTKNVIAAILPIPDQKSSYFATLVFYYFFSERREIQSSVEMAKKSLLTGNWPKPAKELALCVYEEAIHTLFDQMRKKTGTNTRRFNIGIINFLRGNVLNNDGSLALPLPVLCYCLRSFNFSSLNPSNVSESKVLALVSSQFDSIIRKHLEGNAQDEQESLELDIFVNSIRLFG